MTSTSLLPVSHSVGPAFSVSYGATDLELSKTLGSADTVATIIARAFRFIIAVQTNGTLSAYSGELGKSTISSLARLANLGALQKAEWPDSVGDRPPSLSESFLLSAILMNKLDLDSWVSNRKTLLALGRGPNLKPAAKDEVLKDAASVCMYRGCGKRVDKIGKSSRIGNVGQLAHIVGADPKGPRGRDDSHALADKAENVMLVCYDHHRLLDAIDPEAFTIAILQEMRLEHMQRVNSLLGQLAWKRAMPLVIRGGIAGQSTAVTFREISEAMESNHLSALHPEGEYLSMAPIERPEFHYGSQVLSQLKPAIHRLITACQSGAYSPSQDNLAVFAIHDTPVLVLAGRILGEARTAHVFQRTRGEQSPWRWIAPSKQSSDVELVTEDKVVSTAASAIGLITISLSDKYQDAWIADSTRQSMKDGQMTWISISARCPGMNIIEAPCDLEQILKVVRENFRRLQGDFQVREIYLIIVAPVSVAFSIGRTLQAGNHLPVTVFHRVNFSKPFEPVFKIFSDRVENADGGQIVRVQLQ